MSHGVQKHRIALVATALTCLLAGAVGGGSALHRRWTEKLSDAKFLRARLKALTGDSAPREASGAQAALVRVSRATVEDVQPEKPVVGRLREVRKASVASEVTGVIVAIDVEQGSPVTGGKTVLARVDDTWAKLDIAKQTARIQAIQAQLKNDRANVERLRRSLERQVATPKEYDDQLAAAEQRAAELSEAQAQLKDLQEKFRRLQIVAPFDGWVTQKHAELGERLTFGSLVVDVVSRGTIYAEVNVPESMINVLAPGREVPVRIDPLERTLTGKIVSINPYGATASRTYPVRVALDDAEGELKVGMSVTAVMPDGRQSRQIMVSRDAVLVRPDGSTVWVVTACDGGGLLARPVPVEIAATVGARHAVRPVTAPGRAALKDRCRVVIEGAERLYPNQPVRIMPTGATRPAVAAKTVGS